MISCILCVVSVAERVGDREQQKTEGVSEQRKKFLQFKPRKVLSVAEKVTRVNCPVAYITQLQYIKNAVSIESIFFFFKRSRVYVQA